MKSYEATKDYIKKIISPIEKDKLNKINKEKILDNIVIIKLKQSLDEYVDEDEEGKNKIKIKQCYGVDSLFIKIFDLFVNQRISRYEIDKAKYLLIKIYVYKLKASKLILYYSYQDYFVRLMKDTRRNELFEEINSLYKGDIDDIDELREKLKSEVDEIKDKNKVIFCCEYIKMIFI